MGDFVKQNTVSCDSDNHGKETAELLKKINIEKKYFDEDDDDDLFSDYDVISSPEYASSENEESDNKVRTLLDGCNKRSIPDLNRLGGSDTCLDHFTGRSKRLLNRLFIRPLIDEKASCVVLRLFRSEKQCGRFRVNPIDRWYAKITINNFKMKTDAEKHHVDKVNLDASKSQIEQTRYEENQEYTDEKTYPLFRTKPYQDKKEVFMDDVFKFLLEEVDLKSVKSLDISCSVYEHVSSICSTGSVFITNDNLLGSGVLTLQFNDYTSCGGDLTLVNYAQSEASESSLLVSLNYLPLSERLSIIVMKAKDLKLPDSMAPTTDSCEEITPKSVYVKVELFKNEKKVRKKKTSTKLNTANPVFNDQLTFDVLPRDLKEVSLKLSVVQRMKPPNKEKSASIGNESERSSGEAGSHDLQNSQMGTSVVGDYFVFGVVFLGGKHGSRSEIDHFEQMLKTPRVPLAKWHLLRATTF